MQLRQDVSPPCFLTLRPILCVCTTYRLEETSYGVISGDFIMVHQILLRHTGSVCGWITDEILYILWDLSWEFAGFMEYDGNLCRFYGV